jgi:hypothetical protein
VVRSSDGGKLPPIAMKIKPRIGFVVALAAVVAPIAAGCSASATSTNAIADPAGRKDAAASGNGGSGGGFGTGGPGNGGASGSGAPGTGGAAASDGAAADAGADTGRSADAGATPPGSGCQVILKPVAPARWINLPVGRALRVHADIIGTRPPSIDWRWSFMFEGQGWKTLSATTADADIPLDLEGQYAIRAEASPSCAGTAAALAVDPSKTPTDYWLRAVPPPGTAAAVEGIVVTVPPGTSVTQAIEFHAGAKVSLDPQIGENDATTVPSFMRVTSPSSGLRLEGFTGDRRPFDVARPFDVVLDPALSYELLVIPDGALTPTEGAPAPKLFSITSAFPRPLLVVDRGVAVSGQITGPGGPVTGARVLLRAAALPSTVGVSNAQGQFALNARPGDVGALVVPPTGSGLMQAQVDEGVVMVGPSGLALDFRWRALPALPLALTVLSTDGTAAVPGVVVRLEAAGVPDVGELTVAGSTVVLASGLVRVEATTDASGAATFAGLPAATYTVTLIPSEAGGALTITTLELTPGSAGMAHMLRLGRKLDVRGRLVPVDLGAGATVVAVDPTADPARPRPTALADADGMYRLAVDPGRVYRLFIEPAPARGLARIPLGPIAGDADVPPSDHRVPPGVTITGVASLDGRPMAGALVQAYCLDGSDCKDRTNKSTEGVRPTAEAVSGADGTFRLVVPDLAMVY